MQFVVALVDTVVYSTGVIDTVVKWNVDVALSHVTDHMYNSMHRKTLAWIRHRDVLFQPSHFVQSLNFEQINNSGYSLKALQVVCQSIRERNECNKVQNPPRYEFMPLALWTDWAMQTPLTTCWALSVGKWPTVRMAFSGGSAGSLQRSNFRKKHKF